MLIISLTFVFQSITCVRKHMVRHQICDNSINTIGVMAKTVITPATEAILVAILESSLVISSHPLDS